MKFLFALILLAVPLIAMDKPVSPRALKDQKQKKEEKLKTPRDKKEKERRDAISLEPSPSMIADRKKGAAQERMAKSESPLKKDISPARANTVGKKRGSLDWTEVLKSTFKSDSPTKQTHEQIHDSIKAWSEPNIQEEELAKLYEEAQFATPQMKKILLCQIMNSPLEVSPTKVKVATDIYKPFYEVAGLALYNLPGYISTNISGDQLRAEANNFHRAFGAALAAYVDSLLAEAPKRERYKCQETAMKSPHSPLQKLWTQYKEIKKKNPNLKQYLEPEIYPLPEAKKP